MVYKPTTERMAQKLGLDVQGFKNYFKAKIQGDKEPGSGECLCVERVLSSRVPSAQSSRSSSLNRVGH
jgi:hypothetical protein